MQNRTTRSLRTVSFRVVSCLMILSMLLSGTAINPVKAAVSQTASWTSQYASSSYPSGVVNPNYTVATGSNRLLVVAIASTRTTDGSQTVSNVTFGGQALTLADGDGSSSGTPNHSYLYYLTEAGIQAASGNSLNVTISGGSSYYTWIYAAVFEGVDQTTPLTDAENRNDSSGDRDVGPFSPTLTIASGDQAIEIVNLACSSSWFCSPRTIGSNDWATGWTVSGVAPASRSGYPSATLYIRNRSVTTAANDGSEHRASSSSTLESMTAMSIRPLSTVTISGSVGAAGAGATISYTGGSTTADGSSGNYAFSVSSGWSGTVTPSKTNYSFSPVNRTYTNVTTNQTNQNYTATLNAYTISGSVGVAGAGATINYTGGSTTADVSTGNYSFGVSQGWSGTVTPSKVGYTFSPTNRSYTNITANQTAQDYSATVITYTISGSTGVAGAGATITYTGGSTTADGATGNYSFIVPYGWTGTVTPSKIGFDFTPVSRSYSNVTSNQISQNYAASVTMYTISGNVGVGAATLSYTDGTSKTATANSSGVYSLQVSYDWSGTITPSKAGFAFLPAIKSYTNVVSNQTAQDYVARPTAFNFASMGDASAEAAYFSATVNQIASLNPALVIFNGDLEDTGFVLSQINPMVTALKSANIFNKTFLVRGNADDHVTGSAALWENYFETAPNIKVLPPFVINKEALNSASDNLNYSFDYGNSIFIGLDIPGDIDNMTEEQLAFLDSRLTYAEGQGLVHAFIFSHGPEYPITSVHSLCSERDDNSCTPPSFITIINNHPIVSATFHGHEQVLGWVHMDSSRDERLSRSYEQFYTSPAGGATYNEYVYPDRIDYFYPDMDASQGYAAISVNGSSFTYSIYKVGTPTPVWSHTFSKVNTPPTISDITDKSTEEDIVTGDISFTVGDEELSAAYLTVTASSSDTNLVPNENISLGGSAANRSLNIMPAPNQNGETTITVTVYDGNVTVNDTFLLTVDPVNDVPVANAQSLSTLWNTSLDITLTGTDVEISPLTYSIVDEPVHGSLSGSGPDQTYTPNENYSGSDSFTFKVNDATVDSESATISITVLAHTISGNAGVAGATISYTIDTPKTVTANGAGEYSFQIPTNWSGTVTPSKPGYTFSPVSLNYNNVLSDKIAQDYTATINTYTISGISGFSGVTLSYTEGTPKTAISDDDGQYSFVVPYGWSGMVIPSLSPYGFRPGSRTYTNVTSNQYAQDYIPTTSK
ncbi:MAG: Ig-like domain-containing protein, partial [Chloroflexota bacterium]